MELIDITLMMIEQAFQLAKKYWGISVNLFAVVFNIVAVIINYNLGKAWELNAFAAMLSFVVILFLAGKAIQKDKD